MSLSLLFLEGLGTSELVIILLIGLLLFGGRLPEVGRSLGKTIVKLKNSMKEFSPEVEQARAQIHEVTQGIRNAAEDVRNDVERAIESDPRRSASPPSPSSPMNPVVHQMPGMPPEAYDPWLGTEVAPGYVADPAMLPSPSVGPTGATGVPPTEPMAKPIGPVTTTPPGST